jgi:hypothetical protein
MEEIIKINDEKYMRLGIIEELLLTKGLELHPLDEDEDSDIIGSNHKLVAFKQKKSVDVSLDKQKNILNTLTPSGHRAVTICLERLSGHKKPIKASEIEAFANAVRIVFEELT